MAPRGLLFAFAASTSSSAVQGAPADPCTSAHCVPVFYPGLEGSKCYRIPSIIRTSTGTLLAFAENRLNGCGDQGTHNLVGRRSSDGGKSWGPLVTVFEGVVPCTGCPKAVSNPNPVEVSLANGSKAILMAFDTMNNPSSSHHGLDMQIWSLDDGQTWGTATQLVYPPETNVGSLMGPAVGLETADGTLLFWITSGYLIYSRDRGTTWAATPRASIGGECSVHFAESPSNGKLIMFCRSGKNHRRSQFFWEPSGDSWKPTEPTYPDEFTDPGCQGSITNIDGSLFTSNAASTVSREGMTIHRSDDKGSTWSRGLVVHEGPSAYSQLVGLQDGDLGVLFEAGVKSPYETISFAAVPWVDPPAPPATQRWSHRSDSTLSTDGKHCLDWTSKDGHSVYVSSCDPEHFPHHKWALSSDGKLSTDGAGSLVLDWTSSVGSDGYHVVYMKEASANLPHQRWKLSADGTLTAEGGVGLCLGWLPGGAVRMMSCQSLTSSISV